MQDQLENLEIMSTNFEQICKNDYYMMQRMTDLSKINRIKINFNFCHIAISKNGGLIALCKQKGFIDTSRNTKLNNYIIVMFQNEKELYEIPIDWKYSERWIVCLDFTEKQDLYGILNDGGIFKFKYKEKIKKEKITFLELKKQGVAKAKFFQKGFIAYTNFENFYYIKDIKDPIGILLFNMSGLIKLSPNFEFFAISPENSQSNKIEVLLTYEEGNGVVHIEQKLSGENFQVKIIDENTSEIVGINLIYDGKPKPFIINNKRKSSSMKNLEGDYPSGFGKISAIAISPSGKKISFYNSEKKTAFIMDSDFKGDYSTVSFTYNMDDYSKNENAEIEAVLEYKAGYQFLFCGEDAVALSGQRFVILSKPNATLAKPYLIKEGSQVLAMQGVLFSRCISEIDGIRCLTNDGVYFISKVPKELVDISLPFSKSSSKILIKIYIESFSKKYNLYKEMQDLEKDLPEIVSQLQNSSANIFWTEDENEDQKKEAQLFVLKVAQYGKNFVKKGEFNFERFNEICKEMRIINQLRNDDRYPIFITYKEYIDLSPEEIIDILIKYKNFRVAAELCEFLDYGIKKVKYKFMLEKMKYKLKQVEELLYSDNKSKEKEEEIYKDLLNEIAEMEDISYVNMAKKAIKFGSEKFAMKLLDQEKSPLTKIPQLIELKKTVNTLDICFETYDFNILSIVLEQISKKVDIMEILCNPELKHHQQKILLFLKKFKPYKVKEFLKKTNNNTELFYMKLNELFKAQTLEKKKILFEECKTLCKNSDVFSKYKKYLENLEHVFNFKKSCIDENIIHYSELEPYKLSVNDCFLNGTKNNKYNWLETQNNKFLDYSNKKLNIIRFRSCLEKNIPEVIDTILEKTPLKKLGLTPLNMGEIYYDYKFYNKATEYLMQVKESGNNNYVVTMLKNMGKNKEALEVIFSDKDNDNLPLLVNDILKIEPSLKGYVDELCSKYKISLQ